MSLLLGLTLLILSLLAGVLACRLSTGTLIDVDYLDFELCEESRADRRQLLTLEALDGRDLPSTIGPSVIDPSTAPVYPSAPPIVIPPPPLGDYPTPTPGLT